MLPGPGWISKVIIGYEGYDSEPCRSVLRVLDEGDLDVSLEPRNLFSQRCVLSSAETVVSWHSSEEATTDGKRMLATQPVFRRHNKCHGAFLMVNTWF